MMQGIGSVLSAIVWTSGATSAAPAAWPNAVDTLFDCETYSSQNFGSGNGQALVADDHFESARFGVLFSRDPESDRPDLYSPHVKAPMYLFNGFQSSVAYRRRDDGTFTIGVASRGDMPNAHHQDTILLYHLEPDATDALASIVQTEWSHGSKDKLSERVYHARCSTHYNSDAIDRFESMKQ